jgi:hypothetical protein
MMALTCGRLRPGGGLVWWSRKNRKTSMTAWPRRTAGVVGVVGGGGEAECGADDAAGFAVEVGFHGVAAVEEFGEEQFVVPLGSWLGVQDVVGGLPPALHHHAGVSDGAALEGGQHAGLRFGEQVSAAASDVDPDRFDLAAAEGASLPRSFGLGQGAQEGSGLCGACCGA